MVETVPYTDSIGKFIFYINKLKISYYLNFIIPQAQFFCVNIHLAVGLYNRCKAPFWLNCFTITYVSTLVILFANFYYQSYKKDRNTTPVIEEIRDRIDVNAGGDYIHNKIL